MTENLCESGTSEAWQNLDPNFVQWVIWTAAQDEDNFVMTTTLNGDTQLEEEAVENSDLSSLKFYSNGGTRAPREYLGEVYLDMTGDEPVITTQNFVAGQWEYKIEKIEDNAM